MKIKVRLPFPPSGNLAYHNTRNQGRALTKRSRDYKAEVATLIRTQGLNLGLLKPLRVTYFVHPPDDGRKHDLANLDKIMTDALEAAGVMKNDHQIADLRFIRQSRQRTPFVYAVIEELLEDPEDVDWGWL